jgi:acetyl-CoA carboxylase biotin carboxyl carrier protein
VHLTREDVEDILKVLDSTDYDELHLETDRFVLRLRRAPGGWTEEHEARGQPRLLAVGAADEPARGEALDPDPDVDPDVEDGRREGLHPVRAPLPGVFYRAPKPGAPPFVEVGDRVEADTVVAILETMKLMNPVRAGAAGTVADFAVADSAPAPQGAVLLWLAPDGRRPGEP